MLSSASASASASAGAGAQLFVRRKRTKPCEEADRGDEGGGGGADKAVKKEQGFAAREAHAERVARDHFGAAFDMEKTNFFLKGGKS